MGRRHAHTEDAEINITPLTDIFLVLVIIVLAASAAAVDEVKQEVAADKSSGLRVNLPSGAAQEIDPARNSLVVGIRLDGELVVNGTTIPDGELDNVFKSAFSRDKNTQVVLKADTGVNHGRVVGVMERAKQVGLSRLAIATKGGG